MKKRTTKPARLRVSKTTLRHLTAEVLGRVAGGAADVKDTVDEPFIRRTRYGISVRVTS